MKDVNVSILNFRAWTNSMHAVVLGLLCSLFPGAVHAQSDWQKALANMPLPTPATVLHETNAVPMMLKSFQSNAVIKALVFMPMATDEFFFFHRARARLDPPAATLLDAVTALTNQTNIRVTFRPPFLLVHSRNDMILPKGATEAPALADQLKAAPFLPYFCWFDRDWNYAVPLLEKSLKIKLLPDPQTTESWHFYRHSIAGYGLSGWEVLEAMGLAAETRFTVRGDVVEFTSDGRPTPPETQWPIGEQRIR
ncbi:MAG: hypothetical protein WCO56_19630 [Verrucomicrobiota bacterium]